jgi:uncharacterized protein YegP (UPF0339 family)
MIPRWERVQTGKDKWHVRFRAGNGEVVVHGENLTSRGSCDTAIEAVAGAHSPVGIATVDGDEVVVHRSYVGEGKPTRIPIVDVDERRTLFGKRRG